MFDHVILPLVAFCSLWYGIHGVADPTGLIQTNILIRGDCKNYQNKTHSIIESPMYPGHSRGGICEILIRNQVAPQSVKVYIDNIDLQPGDYIMFQDLIGKTYINKPQQANVTFGYILPIKFEFKTVNAVSNSRFRIVTVNKKFVPPCLAHVDVEYHAMIVGNPRGPDGVTMPSDLFCEIRFSVESKNYVQLSFRDLYLEEHDKVYVLPHGPEFGDQRTNYKLDWRSQDVATVYTSIRNIISVVVITHRSQRHGSFQMYVEKLSLD